MLNPSAKPAARHRVLLGEITGAHGIRGEVVIRSYTADPAAIAAYGILESKDGRPLPAIKVVRVSERGVIARLAGVADRTAAERFKATELWIERGRMPAPTGEEFYHADLIGLAAVTPDGTELGEVVSIENFGAGDLIEMRLANSRETEFIPFTRACVPEIDIASRRVVIIRPETVDAPPPEGEEESL